MKTHYPDDQGRPLCGAPSQNWPKPRPVRMEDRSVKVMILPEDVSCLSCFRLSPEWYIRRPPTEDNGKMLVP